MNRRWSFIAATLAIVVACAALVGWRWVRPYSLPDLPRDLSLHQTGLDFTAERQTAERGAIAGVPYLTLKQQLRSGSPPEVDAAIAGLKQAVTADPGNLVYGNLLRTALVRLNRTTELVDYFGALPGSDASARVQKALGLVDGLQNPELASASLGQVSLRSITELDQALAENPYNWVARLSRGLNNLYWPIGLRRTDKAIADLGYAVAIIERFPALKEPYLALAYAAYGDALVKGDKVGEGLRVWQKGLARFPGSAELQQRTQVGQGGAVQLVGRERGIDTFTRPSPAMTDLSVIWDPEGQVARP